MPENHVRNSGGEHAEFLIRLLLLLARCGEAGVTQEDIEELYRDEKGNRPVEKTIRRAIHKLNAIMDPSTSEKESMFRTPKNARPIQMQTKEEHGQRIRRYYLKKMIQLPDEAPIGKSDSNLVFNLIGQKKQLLAEEFETLLSLLSGGLRPDAASDLLQDLDRYVYVSGFSPAQSRANLHKLVEIFRAIRRGLAVEFHYTSANTGEKTSHRIVNPYGLVYRSGVWYLVGQNRENNARRIFRIDHMDRLMVRENLLFTLPADFSLSQYYGNSWGIWTESGKCPEPETVTLAISAAVASHFDATRYHESQTVTILDDGSRRVQFHVGGAVEMIPWLLGWGATVRVIEPAWLRQEVRERAGEILAQYENDQ